MAQEKHPSIFAGEIWKDTDGIPINAHGAGILKQDSIYYLFGEIKKGDTRLVPGQSWEDYRVPAGGVSCYSSKDLLNWKFERVALASTTGDSTYDLDTSRVIERPKVVFNKKTKKFVMWIHVDKDDYSYARAGVAISDQATGPYKYLGSSRPNGQMSRDITLFKDDDDSAYIVYASEDNNTMHICLLSDDYLSATSNYKRILIDQRREAPALFKSQNTYYLITSYCSGWNPNTALYAVSDSLMGEWENKGNPCIGPLAETTFDAQSTYVLPLDLEKESFLFMADRWNKLDLPDSRYLWLPFLVTNKQIEIKWIKENQSGQ